MTDIADWLLTPLSGAAHAEPPAWLIWHARAMVAGWSVVLPLGMLIARFFKVTPGQDWPRVLDNPLWWRWHVRGQSFGVALVTLGLALAFGRGVSVAPLASWHHRIGWLLAGIAWAQVVGGLLRGDKGGPTDARMRGDHYDMTIRRRVFERVHKTLGWMAPPLAVVATAMGLWLADTPRWMPLLLALWWLSIAAAFVVMEASGRRVSTYQAIWGPDPIHPGNRRARGR